MFSINEQDLETDVEKDPPDEYLPKGWLVFQLLGPFGHHKIRVNFFSDKYAEGKKNDRTDFCQAQSVAKEAGHDNAFNDDCRSESLNSNSRGVGERNRKYLERAAQRNAQFSIQQYEAEVMK